MTNDNIWHIMTALDPKIVEERLLDENMLRERDGRSPFQYFIPYSFLKRRVADRNPEDESDEGQYFNPKNRADVAANNELRSALKRFIFIKAAQSDLDLLLADEANRPVYQTLWFYRDHSRQKVTVADADMQRFISACCDKRIKFEVWPALENLEENDEVVLNITQFKGYKAHVLEVHPHKNGGYSLTVGINLFHGALMLKLPHVRMQDLLFECRDATPTEREKNRYRLIEDTQRKLLAILDRRSQARYSDTAKRRDAATLELVYTYRFHHFCTPVMQRKFLALMLLCAILRGDRPGQALLLPQVEEALAQVESQPTGKTSVELRAFLQAILFLATGRPAMRAAALAYYHSHPRPTATHQLLMRHLV